MLQRKQLGNTNLQVSEIGFGCWQRGSQVAINGISLTYGDFGGLFG